MDNKIIDLFSGAGGLTTGFHLAGFESLCAIDQNKKALQTYHHNYPNAKVICDDIRNIKPSDLRSLLNLKIGELAVIIGGTPCQGFSRNVPAEYRYLEDPRNQLYQNFLEFIAEFRPRYVVIENVPEVLRAYQGKVKHEIFGKLEKLGYRVNAKSLNASHYGVPQIRSRAFFIASLEQLIQFPEPTHSKDYQHKNDQQLELFSDYLSPITTVREAIGDLPPLEAGQSYELGDYPEPYQNHYQKILRHKNKKITNHIARQLSSIQLARVRLLKEGQDARNLPADLAPKKYYSGAYGRLFWEQPAKTITRWVFHPGSGRFFHPSQDRVISIREAARLHSYPDTFHFLGTYTEMASQIGESVPPLLARVIAEAILRTL
jgi:DNA (cytosine-5)-methyltransferase 1